MTVAPTAALPDRRTLRDEVVLVLALSLGASAVYALVSFLASLTAGKPLSSQTATLNGSLAPGRPLLDLTYQLLAVLTALVPVALAWHFLHRSGESFASIGFDARQPGRDLARGAVLAAIVGGTGLAFYLLAHAVGVNLTVVASGLPAVWWRLPVLVLSAVENAVLEEVIIAGYLLHRLHQLGWADRKALALSAGIRGSYHLYQGAGGFVGNAAMGVLFGWLYQRWGRCAPLVVAHALIDSVAFVGYVLLAGHVSWLPA